MSDCEWPTCNISLQGFQEYWDPKDSREGTGLKDFRGSGDWRELGEQRAPGDFPVSKVLKDNQEIPGPYTAGKRVHGNMTRYNNMGYLRLVVVR